jgi:dTDP-4-amino-4,6-dideoxygalactose transaminase
MMKIPFNKPFLSGKEVHYLYEGVHSGKISGDGIFSRKCQQLLEATFGFRRCFLTTSCTDALEMAAILLNIKEGDEVIMPSFTFVSTANAFVLRGAKIVFADSGQGNPNIDPDGIEALITDKTKAIVVVHYAGVACDLDPIMALAKQYGLFVVEDAAKAIDSYYKGKPLGSIGHLAAFSFHETKNIQCGEGGCLVVNDEQFIKRAEIIREKGTNRSAFFRGEIDKYSWVDIGSSFLPSEITAAFLFAQLESLSFIQKKRLEIWEYYYSYLSKLEEKGKLSLPKLPAYATNNAHMFYLVCNSAAERDGLLDHLVKKGIMAIFHYLPLHESPFYGEKHDGRVLANTDRYSNCILRLPLFVELDIEEIEHIIKNIYSYFDVNYKSGSVGDTVISVKRQI